MIGRQPMLSRPDPGRRRATPKARLCRTQPACTGAMPSAVPHAALIPAALGEGGFPRGRSVNFGNFRAMEPAA
ncbi:hypothetical protein FHT00_002748 [Sphingomonas insulae]|nr:hypothetical protein [Sphingomonas insulae]